MKAMKLTLVSVEQAEPLLRSDDWVAEQKFDGARALLKVTPRPGQEPEVEWLNGAGTPLKFAAAAQHLPRLNEEIARTMKWLGRPIVLDGEFIPETATFHAFDLPYMRGHVMVNETPFAVRRLALLDVMRAMPRSVQAVDSHRVPTLKRRLFEQVRDGGAEGIVLKHLDGLWVPGIRSQEQRKVKFTHTADLVVMERDTDGRKNAVVGAWFPQSGVHRLALRKVANVSMIGKPDAQVGDVVEVEFLYWTGESITQPRVLGVREDKDARECDHLQFLPYHRDVVSVTD